MPFYRYDFTTFGPAESVQIQIEASGVPVQERQFLVAATVFPAVEPDAPRVSPGDLNWPYSQKLDTSFTYLPPSDGLGPFRLRRALSSTTPFSRVRLDIVQWAAPSGEPVRGSTFGRLVYAVRSSSDIPALAKRPVVYGVATPEEGDG